MSMTGYWGMIVLKFGLASVVLTLFASMGSQPSYNFPIALLSVFVPHLPKPFLTSLLFVLLPISLLLDIIWASLYGPYLDSGAPLLALILMVLNLFLKVPWAYAAYELMNESGGSPIVLLNPELAIGGAGLGDGSHERITDI